MLHLDNALEPAFQDLEAYAAGPLTQRISVQEERRSYPADLDTRHEPRTPEWFVVP
jgi:hypothetical protein